jgi:CheY-like chemotaxis protein
VERSFRHIAHDRGLDFHIEISPDLPETISTDDMRLRQVLRNLLSNAFKFTDRGEVSLRVFSVTEAFSQGDDVEPDAAIAFAVRDTGVGIPLDQQRIIFEAFQQADGGTSRRYGGTGLGLSISREIARLLGGELQVASEVSEGSTFTLYLPLTYPGHAAETASVARPTPAELFLLRNSSVPTSPARAHLVDDRASIRPQDRVLLIVEDDDAFARTLLEVAHEHEFRGVVALDGAKAWELAKTLKPHAITLDVGLPDMDGWVLLDRLKHDADTRHVPVQIISASDGEHDRGRWNGAISVLRKPLDRDSLGAALGALGGLLDRVQRRLLVVDADDGRRREVLQLVGGEEVEIVEAASADDALGCMADGDFDCILASLGPSREVAFDVLRALDTSPEREHAPVVLFDDGDLTLEEREELARLSRRVLVKRATSPETVFDAASRFLHLPERALAVAQRELLRRLAHTDPRLDGKTVLVVDDDIRNIFAITAILERHGVHVLSAENGQDALESLSGGTTADLVLMDIMLPGMGGYEATRRIRALPAFAQLPVIALTAKAMKGDREKCLAAGASDYISKPVDPDQLVSLLRVWLTTRCH